MSMKPTAQRPRVLILGGGFAGVGAAKALKDADVDVVLVDKHDYHTFQPLLYQVATALLETAAVGHPLRDLFHEQPNVTVHQATVTGDRPRQARGAVRRDGAADLRLPRAGARRGGQLLRSRGRSRARLPDVHARRRGAPQEARPGQVGSRGPGREPRGRRRSSTSSSSAAGRPGWRAPARSPSSTGTTSRRTTRTCRRRRRGSCSSRLRPSSS